MRAIALDAGIAEGGDASFMPKYALRVRQQAKDLPLWQDSSSRGRLGSRARERARILREVYGRPEKLALALVKEGLGSTAWPGLRRVRAVRKSATAAAG